jgi:hypothetical protein
MTENLSYQPFSTISLDRAPQLLRSGDSQPAYIELVGQDEERAVATVDAGTVLVGLLKVSTAPDPLTGAEFHQLSARDMQLRSCADSRALTAPLLAADCKTLTSFRTASLEHEAPVFGAHANEKSVGSLAVPRVWLERALSLHDIPSAPRAREIERSELSMVANAFWRCQSE